MVMKELAARCKCMYPIHIKFISTYERGLKLTKKRSTDVEHAGVTRVTLCSTFVDAEHSGNICDVKLLTVRH